MAEDKAKAMGEAKRDLAKMREMAREEKQGRRAEIRKMPEGREKDDAKRSALKSRQVNRGEILHRRRRVRAIRRAK